MEIAIIVVSCILAAGLIALFVTVQVQWRRTYPKLLPNGEVRPKQTAKEWFKNHIPSKRRLIQIYAALLYNANIKGFISGRIYDSKNSSKYVCVPGFNCYSCPGAVGACPLGALQNALTDANMRAPYYVLGILAIFGIMFARTICGFLCPVGLGQDLLYKIRTPKLKKSRVTRVFSYLKYVILAVFVIAVPLIYAFLGAQIPAFCKYICPAGTFGGALMILANPNNAGEFARLGPMFTWKFCVMVAIIVAAIFIYRFFCRFLCPLGEIYGFFNRFALLGVKVDKDNCTDCGLCVSHCKMDVKRVGDHECINCGECISVCPSKAINWKGAKLFVHENAVPAPAEAERPLGNLAASVSAAAVAEAAAAPVNAPADEIAVTAEQPTTTPAEEVRKPKRKKSKKFWLELSAWIAALLVLIGALVYYNAIDVKQTVDGPPQVGEDGKIIGSEIGNTAPDFTIQLYGAEGGTFNLYEHRGKVTVINFWATWCYGCKLELPHFNKLTEQHTEWNVVAIHGDDLGGVKAEAYLAESCAGWALPFAQDNFNANGDCATYVSFGGKDTWPLTVIVDEEGTVIYNSTYEFKSYEELETAVLTAIGN